MTVNQASPAPLGRWPQSQRPMGIGFIMPVSDLSAFGGTPRFRDMLEMTQVAEELGLDAVWIPDHFLYFYDQEPTRRGVWEAWTTLAGIAAATSRITLGIYVTCLGWRNPGIVAKMAENLDEISGGRFILGIGAGWNEPEYSMFGMPFDHRLARFEDAFRIIQPFLREGKADHQGDFYQANDAVHLPRGPRGSEGGPPIMVGTSGPKTMRLTAQYADAWNSAAAWHKDASSVVPLMEQLDTLCEEVGRDPKTLVRSVGSTIKLPGAFGRRPDPITGEPEEIAEVLAGFREIGLRHHAAGLDPTTPASLEQYARIVEILDRS